MDRITFLAILLFTGILFSAAPVEVFAQTDIERVSVSERSDGKGYVVRYHLSSPADSFKIAQPEEDLIQLMIYSADLQTTDLTPAETIGSIQNIEFHENPSGIGTDIVIKDGHYYKTNVYPDQNGSHLLLSLERTTAGEAELIAANSDFIYWHSYLDDTGDFAFDFAFGPEDDVFLNLRDSDEFNVIVLDPGHGGRDPGAINRSLGLREKDIALAVALKVGEYINEYMPDVEVVYTRDDDRFVELAERGKIASRARGDLFVSIHANSARNVHASGTEVYFMGLARSASALEVMKRENSVIDLENGGGPTQLSEEELLIYELANAGNIAVSEKVAGMIEDQFRTRAQRRSRGVKQAGFMVLWNLPMPAVLIELGFLTNATEAQYMASEYGQTILASAIFRAIRDFKEEYDRSRRPNNNRASNE
jgi:N-acetylmuramoyl-L-alanine amidase